MMALVGKLFILGETNKETGESAIFARSPYLCPSSSERFFWGIFHELFPVFFSESFIPSFSFFLQANHGGIKGKLPTGVSTSQDQPRTTNNNDDDGSGDEGAGDEVAERLNQSGDDDDEPEIEMNWNLCLYLPVSGACQTNFNVSRKKNIF